MAGYLDLRAWKKKARDGAAPQTVALRRVCAAQVTRASDDPRTYEFVLSTAAQDRYHDTIEVAGWDTSNYLSTGAGPVLWAHDATLPPIGSCRRIWVQDGALRGTLEFPIPGTSRLADELRGLVEAGALSACSVGFLPIKWTLNEDTRGVDFIEQELLEWSLVSIPANPEATIQARAAVPDLIELHRWVAETQVLLGHQVRTVDHAALKAMLDTLGLAEDVLGLPADEIPEVITHAFERQHQALAGELTVTEAALPATVPEEWTFAAPLPAPVELTPAPVALDLDQLRRAMRASLQEALKVAR